jgi:transcriptional regulator with XRE-family HTH domain
MARGPSAAKTSPESVGSPVVEVAPAFADAIARVKISPELERAMVDIVAALVHLTEPVSDEILRGADEEVRVAFERGRRTAQRIAADRRFNEQPGQGHPDRPPTDVPTIVRDNLAFWRRTMSRWSQVQLADAMNRLGYAWSRVTVAEIENGSRKVSLDELLALAGLYGLPLIELLRPPKGQCIRLEDGRVLDEDASLQMVLGEANIRTSAADWSYAAAVANVKQGGSEDDWRPAKTIEDARSDSSGDTTRFLDERRRYYRRGQDPRGVEYPAESEEN